MIRTRDLVIFVVTLLLLGVGIALTLILEKGVPFAHEYTFSDVDNSESVTYTTSSFVDDFSREDFILRLQNALSLHTPEVNPSPSVEEVPIVDSELDEGDESVVKSGIQKCDQDDGSDIYAQTWPLNGVSITTSGALRTVVHTVTASNAIVDVNATTTSSTTAPAQNTDVLIAFPQTPYATPNPQCVPGDVVGVTLTGSLMFNADASFYRGYGPEYLIGYARDGYPIYGYYQGVVDSCGGYMHASGYRYTISPEKDYVLGCYTAAPSSFVR